jgi:flagellar motor switch/type III secretory pathway protein FliN
VSLTLATGSVAIHALAVILVVKHSVLHTAAVTKVRDASAIDRANRYPWHALERTTHRQAAAFRDIRRWITAHVDLPQLNTVLGEILRGAKTGFYVQNTRVLKAARGIPGGVGVLVGPADAPQLESAVLIEAEFPLVATALALVSERKDHPALVPRDPVAPQVSGAMGNLVMVALRRAHQGVAMRMLSAGPAAALESDLARLGHELLALTLTVLIEHNAFEMRIIMPASAVAVVAGSTWGSKALASLGPAPLALSIVGRTLTATTTEIASLRVGDALLVDWPLTRAPNGAWTGPALLASPGGELGVAVELRQDGRAVLRGDVVSMTAPQVKAEDDMAEGEGKSQLVENIGDVPVLLRIEVGEARMAAREWAALTVGDVISLGRPVGQSVVLRVGGVPVALGDLVEIDGDVGVRIVERLGHDTAVE